MTNSARILLTIARLAAAALVIVAVLRREWPPPAGCWRSPTSPPFRIGSLALLMIHRLTGGRWGEALEPLLRPLALTLPLLLLLVHSGAVSLRRCCFHWSMAASTQSPTACG